MVIRLSDVNDNSPRLARKQWDLTVQETWGDREPENTTLLEIAAADRDTANHFYYRVSYILVCLYSMYVEKERKG